MARLIDIDVFRAEHMLAEQCEECKRDDKWHCDEQMYSAHDICGWLDDAPIIDAVPVRHGRDLWEDTNYPCEFKCSLCGKEIREFWSSWDIEYCPFCGAKMDGGEN